MQTDLQIVVTLYQMVKDKQLTLLELQRILADFEKDYWDGPKDIDGKTRHIVLHLTKLIAKVGSVSEQRDHKLPADPQPIITEAIPDLLYWALSLSQLYKINLLQVFLARLEQNKIKIVGLREKRNRLRG